MDSAGYVTLFQLKLPDDGHSFKLNATPPGAPADDMQQGHGQLCVLQAVAPGDPPVSTTTSPAD